LLAARPGERTSPDDAQHRLPDLGTVVNRSVGTLVAIAITGTSWSLGSKRSMAEHCSIEPATGRIVRLQVRYLSVK